MSQTIYALEFLRAWLATASAPEAAEQPRKRRKLKHRQKCYAGPVSINPDAPLLAQLKGVR